MDTSRTPAPFDLSGKRVLVTGAARGIGRAIAVEFARAGADVVLGVLDPKSAQPIIDEISALGRVALAVRLDVTDLPSTRVAIDEARRHGSIDVLVNNAGGGIGAPAIDVTEEDFDAVWNLNTRSTFFISQYVARAMPTGGGSIINIASQAGLVALPGESSYCIAKAAIIHMTRCHAVEWGERGIRVNALAPTFIETDGTAAALADPAFRTDTLERIAGLHRIGVPREVAGAAVFLASPAASLITGQTLAIDGGWTAR
jgi:NAD(P)-dependent dehydrogenase (short-subunit alcohol dehydrogenase family)